MAEFKKGQKVLAHLESGKQALVGFYLGDEGDKALIQVGAEVHRLAYREPEDYDQQGSGRTFQAL